MGRWRKVNGAEKSPVNGHMRWVPGKDALAKQGSKKLTLLVCDLPHTPTQKTINKTVSVVVIYFVLNGNVSFNFPNPSRPYCRYRRCTCCHALSALNLTVDFYALCSLRLSTCASTRITRSHSLIYCIILIIIIIIIIS